MPTTTATVCTISQKLEAYLKTAVDVWPTDQSKTYSSNDVRDLLDPAAVALVIPAKTYDYVHFFVILTAERHVEESERISKLGWQIARVAQVHVSDLRAKLREMFSCQSATQPSPPGVAPPENATSFIQHTPIPQHQLDLSPAPSRATFSFPPPPVANSNKAGRSITASANQNNLATLVPVVSDVATGATSSTPLGSKRQASELDSTDGRAVKKQAVAAAALSLVPLKLDLQPSIPRVGPSSVVHSIVSPSPTPTALAIQSLASVAPTAGGLAPSFVQNPEESLETILNNARTAILLSQEALITQSTRHQEEKAQLLATITELRRKVEMSDEVDIEQPTMVEMVALREELRIMKAREKEMFGALEVASREAKAALENAGAAKIPLGTSTQANTHITRNDQERMETVLKTSRAALLALRSELAAATSQTKAIKADFEACKTELEGTKGGLTRVSEELKAAKADRDRAISERGEAILNQTVLQRRLDDTRAAKALAYQVQNDAVRMTTNASQERESLRVENKKLKEQLGVLGNEWALARTEAAALRKDRDGLQRRVKTEVLIPGIMDACQALEGIAAIALRRQIGPVNQD